MEKILNSDERIRRAEEIYARRKMLYDNKKSATVNVEGNQERSLSKKLIIQSIICIMIYGCYYGVKNMANFIPENVMYKISDVLEYDINIQELGDKLNSYIKQIDNENEIEERKIENSEQETLAATDIVGEIELVQDTVENALKEDENQIESMEEDTTELSQMEIDAKYILENYSLIKPLEGEITSRFGPRESKYANVSKYHTGIDIARVIGTVICSAMDGDVELVSDEGYYGKHLKITNGEVSTLYAHCSKIYVQEGEHIMKGQQIAEVGDTGNVTGPHLHFEIRRNDVYVDPDLILNF